CQQFEDWPLTF
nr:immunoglobulin light chain junction region [Macaca mulatta]MOY04835.1 immunoglobulin light chain junction region [Macaca mulatta]